MRMDNQNMILVRTADDTLMRNDSFTELKVEVLVENVNLFLSQIERIIETVPDEAGTFRFTEFTVTAEVTGEGKLVLFGSGIEASAKGGLTFKFEKKGNANDSTLAGGQ